MYRHACLLLLATLAAPLAACDVRVGEQGVSLEMVEGKASDEWTRTYTVAPGGLVEVVNDHGVIEIFPATGSQVEVRAAREVKSRSDEAAQELLKQIVIAEEVTPGRVRIQTDQPRGGGFRERLTVLYRVHVPAGLAVAARSQHGGVRLENVEGTFNAASTNGMISGRGVSGAIDASTVNGGITVQMVSVAADSRLTTVNGGIRFDAGPDVNATLEASAVNGGVIVREGFPLEGAARERRRVSGRINKGGPRVVLQTTNGGIVIGAGSGRGRPARAEPELQGR